MLCLKLIIQFVELYNVIFDLFLNWDKIKLAQYINRIVPWNEILAVLMSPTHCSLLNAKQWLMSCWDITTPQYREIEWLVWWSSHCGVGAALNYDVKTEKDKTQGTFQIATRFLLSVYCLELPHFNWVNKKSIESKIKKTSFFWPPVPYR